MRIQNKLETDEGDSSQQVGLHSDMLSLPRKNQGSYRDAPGTPCSPKQGNFGSCFEAARDSFSVDSSSASRTSATVQRSRPAVHHLKLSLQGIGLLRMSLSRIHSTSEQSLDSL